MRAGKRPREGARGEREARTDPAVSRKPTRRSPQGRRSAKRSAAGSTNARERNARASEGYPRQPRPAEVGSGDVSRPWRRVGRGETPNAPGESLENAERSDDFRSDSDTALPASSAGESARGARVPRALGGSTPPRSGRPTAATTARGRSPRRTQAHATNQNTRGSGKR